MSEIKILVAHHKPYPMPSDPVYKPFNVKKAELDHNHWCELTALYDAWRNPCGEEAVGLVHYRRYFKGHGGIATTSELSAALEGVDAVLPRKRMYWIETNYSQYVHAHPAEGLEMTRTIIAERHPEYLPAFDASMKRRGGHRFNMLLMRRGLFDRYCTWLFDILFELDRRLDVSNYSKYNARVFGFVAERLLDPWIENNGVRCREVPVLNLESQHWGKKILDFVLRKLKLGGRR